MIASSRSFHCAVVGPERGVRCWASAGPSQSTGDSPPLAADSVPSTVAGVRDVEQLALGDAFGVAVTSEHKAVQWMAQRFGGTARWPEMLARRLPPEQAEAWNARLRRAPASRRPTDFTGQTIPLAAVRGARVSGYHICLELNDGVVSCHGGLSRMPFLLKEVWPSVRFEGANP